MRVYFLRSFTNNVDSYWTYIAFMSRIEANQTCNLSFTVSIQNNPSKVIYEIDVFMELVLFLLQKFEGCNVFFVLLKIVHHFI